MQWGERAMISRTPYSLRASQFSSRKLVEEARLAYPPDLVAAAGLLFPQHAELIARLVEQGSDVCRDDHAAGVVRLDAAREKEPFRRRLADVGHIEARLLDPRSPFGARAAPGVLLHEGIFQCLLDRYGYAPLFDERRPDLDNDFRRFYVPGAPERAGAAGGAVPGDSGLHVAHELSFSDHHADVEGGPACLGTAPGAPAALYAR